MLTKVVAGTRIDLPLRRSSHFVDVAVARGGREVSDLANITDYVRRIEQRPAYVKAMQIAGPKAAPPT